MVVAVIHLTFRNIVLKIIREHVDYRRTTDLGTVSLHVDANRTLAGYDTRV